MDFGHRIVCFHFPGPDFGRTWEIDLQRTMNATRRPSQAALALPEGEQPPRSQVVSLSSTAERDPLAGTQYRTVRSLGRGGMGEVFEAIHVALNKAVVVKLLHTAI